MRWNSRLIVILAQAGLGRYLLEVHLPGMMLLEKLDGPLDSKMWQRGLISREAAARFPGVLCIMTLRFAPATPLLERQPGCVGQWLSGLVVGRAS